MRVVLVVVGILVAGAAWGQLMDDTEKLRAIREIAFLAQHAEQCGIDPAKVNGAANRALNRVIVNLGRARAADVKVEVVRAERLAQRNPLKQGSPGCEQAAHDLAELGARE